MDKTTTAPPPGPPAFLGEEEVLRLCKQGYLSLSLPLSLAQETEAFFSAADAFFKLPTDTKTRLYPPVQGNTEHGYYHIPAEKEFVTFRYSSIDHDPPELEQQLSRIWHDFGHLLYRILADVGHFLHIHDAAWLPLIHKSLTLPTTKGTATPSLLRVFRYEPQSGFADPHNDLGLLTLCICRGTGLQIWEKPNDYGKYGTPGANGARGHSQTGGAEVAAPAYETNGTSQSDGVDIQASNEGGFGRWVDAPSITLLVGDTLRVLSSGRMSSGKHRVTTNPCGRESIVFALRPSTNIVLDLRLFGGEGEVDVKWLWEKIKNNRVNVNAPKATRVEQRQNRARTMEQPGHKPVASPSTMA